MPIDYFKPLDSLKNLSNSGFSYKKPKYGLDSTDEADVTTPGDSGSGMFYPDDNSNLELASLQDQRLSELKDNAAKGLAMAAPQNSQRELESDIASNPITAQRGQVKDYMGALGEANQQGFATPKEAAGYGRQIKEEQMRQPMQIATANNAAEIQKQNIAGQTARDVANIGANAKDAQLEAFKTLINGGGVGGNRRISIAGVGSTGPGNNPPRIPSDQLTMVQKARDAANKAGYFTKDRAQKSLQSAIATALSQHPASGRIKAYAQALGQNPQTAKMSTQDLLDNLDLSEFTPDEVDSLPNILSIIRGQ